MLCPRPRILGRPLITAVAVVAGLVGLPFAAVPDPPPWPWRVVQRSLQSGRQVPHQGHREVVLFRNGQKVAGFRQKVWRGSGGRMRVVVVEPTGQRGRREVCDGKTRWEYYPGSHKVIISQPDPEAHPLIEGLGRRQGPRPRLQALYQGDGHIAGRPAHIIELTTQSGQPVCKLWIDRDRFVQLKIQRFDPQGAMSYSAYFTDISYDPRLAPDLFTFTPPAGSRIIRVPPALPRVELAYAERQAGFRAQLPSYLPPGYQLERQRVAVAHMAGHPVLWLPFSNGVDRFSIFQGPLSLHRPDDRPEWGECWTAGRHCFILIGLLSPKEVGKIKNSMTK